MEIQCPKCLQSVELQQQTDGSGVCPTCGEGIQMAAAPTPVPVAKKSSAKLWIWIAVGVFVGLLVLASVLMIFAKKTMEGVLAEGRKSRVQQDLSTLETALSLYRLNAGTFPSSEQGFEALVSKPTTGKIPNSWEKVLMTEMHDPWGKLYGYRFPGQHRQKAPDIWSFGPDMVDGTEDDIGNWD